MRFGAHRQFSRRLRSKSARDRSPDGLKSKEAESSAVVDTVDLSVPASSGVESGLSGGLAVKAIMAGDCTVNNAAGKATAASTCDDTEQLHPINNERESSKERSNASSAPFGGLARRMSSLRSNIMGLVSKSREALVKALQHRRDRLYTGCGKVAERMSFGLWFTPGIFFIAIGVCTLFAPQLVAAAVAGFCVFVGLTFFALAIKFIQFKRRIERIARSFEARILVQGVPLEKVADPQERREVNEMRMSGSSKKILFH